MKSEIRFEGPASRTRRYLGGLLVLLALVGGALPFAVWRARARAVQTEAREPLCLANEAKIVRRVTLNRAIHSSVGPTLRQFRLAMVATSAYFNSYGSGAASLDAWLAGVNAIYQKEVGIQLMRVGSNALLTAAANYPFTEGNPEELQKEVRRFFKTNLSAGSYDLGIVLGTGSGGTAYIGTVCETAGDADGLFKGGAAALVNTAASNDSNIRLIAHEIGHQFSAMHTQNALNCANRFGETAFEPGSGVTLMSNAGACGSNNIAVARSAYFHTGSFEQINQYLSSFVGASCATAMATADLHAPTVDGGLDYTIPKGTPFTLTATGYDLDAGDVPNLTYTWEQVDAGRTLYFNPPYSDQGDPITTTRPLFRPLEPGTATRLFPSLSYILIYANNQPDMLDGLQTGERLPKVARTLNFRVTVRDGRGGVNNDTVQLNVDNTAGPFRVTFPNTPVTWQLTAPQTVEWDVANTASVTGVNCAAVRIWLSTDGGTTFPHLLADNVPNTGSAIVSLPPGLTTGRINTARLKVAAANSVFFDINDTNFTVNGCTYTVSPDAFSFSAAGGPGSVTVTAGTGCTWSVDSAPTWVSITSGSFGNGPGTVSFTVQANTGAFRSGEIMVAGQTVTINQDGCSYSINPTSQTLPNIAGTGLVNVTATNAICPWTAASNDPSWLTITTGTTGTGNGTVGYAVAHTNDGTRTGTLTIAGQTFTVTQTGCAYSINPSPRRSCPINGETGPLNVTVTAGTNCSWTATVPRAQDQPWLRLNTGGPITGNGTVMFTADPNLSTPNPPRSGQVRIAGATLWVDQDGVTVRAKKCDFDGDGKTDLSVWRGPGFPAAWLVILSSTGALQNIGWGTGQAPYNDVPVPGDYDGDGKTDQAIWRGQDSLWYIRKSINGQELTQLWGASYAPYNDVPVQGDYDGDGKTDFAVWRPGEGTWYIKRSSDGGVTTVQWGSANDKPVPGDYDGDGKYDFAYWRGSDTNWYILKSSGGTQITPWGAGYAPYFDVPVQADYDGDGKTDLAIWRGQDSLWYIKKSSDGQPYTRLWGANYAPYFDVPVPGDYDGDGKADIAVWRPTDQNWYVIRSSNGSALIQAHGAPGDTALPSTQW